MEKRHKHVSPTLDIMAKKIFSLPEVTVAFIRDILDLDVVDAQILEGTQLHKKDFDEDDNRRRNTGVKENISRQSDYRINGTFFQQSLTNSPFGITTEEHTMR